MSDIKPIPLDASTTEQRRTFAIDFLNLTIDPDDDDIDVLSKIKTAQPGVTMIFVRDEPEALQRPGQMDGPGEIQEGAAVVRQAGGFGRQDPRAVIFISKVNTPDGRGNDDVVVGVNGKNWQLKRGVNLPVPWRVVEALGLTIETIYQHKDTGDGKVEEVTFDSERFPVQFIEKPPREEVEAWHKATDHLFCP